VAKKKPPARRFCPSCRVGIIKSRHAKICRACRTLPYKKRQNEIITAWKREAAHAESVPQV